MDKIFLQILNMSFTASAVILVVIGARLLLKKAPKVFSYALWSVVLFRLVCPFSFESAFGWLGKKVIPDNIAFMQTPEINLGSPIINDSINAALPAAIADNSMNPMQFFVFIGTIIWICGIILIAIYSIITLVSLAMRMRGAMRVEQNVYCAEGIATAFIVGFFRPKIYLPTGLLESERRHVLMHEQTHIKRLDHVVKLVGFCALCLHWFNPLVWVAFFLFGRDMELSCDEAVIKKLGNEVKKQYSTSLLALATGRRIVGGSPLAFGEGETKSRIKNVLNYKKPAFWVSAVAVVVVIVLALLLMGNPEPSTKNGTENTTPSVAARALTEQEIAQVNGAFSTMLPATDRQFNVNPISHFFTSYYDMPQNMDMGEFVYYIERESQLTEQDAIEIEKLKENSSWLPFESIENSPVPFGRVSFETVEAYLQKYMGTTLVEMTNMNGAIYSKEYKTFYSYASDFDPGIFSCVGGEIDGETVTLYSENAVLTLKKSGEGYFIFSHVLRNK